MTTAVATRESRKAPSIWRDPLSTVRDEVDTMLSNLIDRDFWPMRLSPHFDLSETDNALEIRMDAPGIKPADIDIQVSGNALTICGERKEEKEEKGRTFHRVERRSGSFSRSIMLPCSVQEDKIEAKYADGILAIVLPKTEAARSRKIKVQS